MFKKLVKRIAEIASWDDFNRVSGEVDTAFQQEKITWADHELLHTLLGKIRLA